MGWPKGKKRPKRTREKISNALKLDGYVSTQVPRKSNDLRWKRGPYESFPESNYSPGPERIFEFFERFITATVGEWKGNSLQLFPWQKEMIEKLYGNFREDGKRQYRQCYLEIGKKSGKTEFCAALGLYHLLWDDENSPNIILAAFDRFQAGYCFKAARIMVQQNEILSSVLKLIESQKKIIYSAGDGILEVVSSETASKQGLNISALIFDELSEQKNRDLYDVLTQGSGAARRQPIYLFLTNAGWDRNSICWEVHEKAFKVEQDPTYDPRFLPILYYVPIDLNWEDENNWKLANPSLGYTFSIEDLQADFKEAKENPAKENYFKQKRLNQWTSQETKWISLSDWDTCGMPLLTETLQKRPCYGGLDLSATTDITAFVLIFAPQNGDRTIDILPFFWMPEEDLKKKIDCDHLPYDSWIAKGLIQGIPGKIVDYDFVRAKIGELRKQYNFSEISYDPWNATQMALDLEKTGLTMVQFKPTFQFFSPPMKEFLTKITVGKVRHGGNPVLRTHLDVMRVIMNDNGDIRPDKSKSNGRIDGMVASFMAYDRLMRHPELEKFIYQPGSISALNPNEPEIEIAQNEIKIIKQKSGILCKRCGQDTEGNEFCSYDGLKVNIGAN